MAGRSVYLHAGAHRTGSSSFQMCLYENRQVLAQRGFDLAYPGRDGVPMGDLALRLPGPNDDPRWNAKYVQKIVRNLAIARTGSDGELILSEENIAGRMIHFNKGRFYPACRRRLEVLAEALPDPVGHLVFVVRSYEELFISAYRKRAENHVVEPFEAFAATYAAMDRGWPEIVALMRDVLRPARLSVVSYKAQGTSTGLLAHMLPGVTEAELTEPARPLNRSASDRALEVVQKRLRRGKKLSRERRLEIVHRHRNHREDRGFARFSQPEAEALKARFSDDLTRIAALQDVEMLASTRAPPPLPRPKAHPSRPDRSSRGFYPSPSAAPQPPQSAV